jgi:hypothetical protein
MEDTRIILAGLWVALNVDLSLGRYAANICR